MKANTVTTYSRRVLNHFRIAIPVCRRARAVSSMPSSRNNAPSSLVVFQHIWQRTCHRSASDKQSAFRTSVYLLLSRVFLYDRCSVVRCKRRQSPTMPSALSARTHCNAAAQIPEVGCEMATRALLPKPTVVYVVAVVAVNATPSGGVYVLAGPCMARHAREL